VSIHGSGWAARLRMERRSDLIFNSLLKTTFKSLRRVGLDPGRIGDIVAGALVLLHIEHNQTTW
jgi:hypothetical protein